MKPVKLLFKLLITIIFIIAIAVAGIIFLVDPNDYKNEIVTQLKAKTGREVNIPGDIEYSIYPWLGLKLGAVSVNNPETFARPVFAKIDALDIRVSFKQLLNLQPEIGVLHIDGLDVTLIKRNDGVSNWDDLVKQEASQQPASTNEAATRSDANQILQRLTISAFDIRNASIKWLDETTNTDIALSDFNLRTGVIQLAAPTSFDLSFTTELNEPKLRTNIISSGKLSTKSDFSSFTLNNWNLSLTASGDDIPNQQQTLQLGGNIIYDANEQLLNLIDIRAELAGLPAIIDVKISELDKEPITKGNIIVPDFSLAKVLQKLAIDVPPMADSRALTNVNFQTSIDTKGQSAVLDKFSLTLDQSKLQGSAKINIGKTTKVNYNLVLDEIDVDKYLPPETDTETETSAETLDEPLDLPVDLIRGLNVDGKFSATSIKAMNIRMREITAKNVVRDNIAQVKLQVEKMYQGKGDSLLSIDARAAKPAVAVKSDFKNIQVGNLLKDYMDTDFINGNGSINLDVRALAETSSQLTSTLNGTVKFDLQDGEINGINIAEKLRQVEAKKEGVQYQASREVNSTDFASLSGSGRIKNGVYTMSSFKLQAPLLRASSKGSIDIAKETFNMNFDAYFVNSKTGQAGKDINDVRSLLVPIKLKGTFSEPDLSVIWSRLLLQGQKGKIDAAKTALQQKQTSQKEQLEQKAAQEKAAAEQRVQDARERARENAKKRLLEKLR